MKITRRRFLYSLSSLFALTSSCKYSKNEDKYQEGDNLYSILKGEKSLAKYKTRFYKKLDEKRIECEVCPRHCRVADRERGYCGNKENFGGDYYSLVHSRPCAVHIDPIEKKPLFHFLPTSKAFSLSTAGCNFECKFCQNWRISQFRPEQVEYVYLPPDMVYKLAKKYSCKAIAFTYGEPVVFYDYMYDIAEYSKPRGIAPVMISNGFMNEKPWKKLLKNLSAVKIDLKAFTEKFYKDICYGSLKPVLRSLEIVRKHNVWLEIVVLIIPTLNDSLKEIRNMARWIKRNLGDFIPIHFTRYYPTYKIKNIPPTPVKTLENAYKVARSEGLKFVYIGNVPGHKYESTYCPTCGNLLIKRIGYYTQIVGLDPNTGKCKKCRTKIEGIWKI